MSFGNGDISTGPRISLIILAYNQQKYIAEAIRGAFSQTYSPLEIIVSDDCSTDNTYSIMRDMTAEYTGPHEVIVNKNQSNLGLINHVNRVVQLATSDIVIFNGGDDVSLPNRVEYILKEFEVSSSILSVSHNYHFINEFDERLTKSVLFVSDGVYDLNDYINPRVTIPIYGCTRAYRKKVFDNFPPLASNCPAEDATLVLRCLILGKIKHISVKSLNYRLHNNSTSRYFNFDSAKGIYKQNKKDLDYAKHMELLDSNQYSVLVEVVKRRIRVALILKRLASSKVPLFAVCRYVLFSDLFSRNEKINHLKESVKAVI